MEVWRGGGSWPALAGCTAVGVSESLQSRPAQRGSGFPALSADPQWSG